jgi:threonine dehydratase
MVGPAEIQQAARRLEGGIRKTPVVHSDRLSEQAGCQVYLKLENLQVTGSFKIRGATNCVAQLTDEEKPRGVITASAGNHAQGVAAAARAAGIRATIVMPETTPVVKVEQTEQYGPEIILSGDDFEEAETHADSLAEERGLTFVHPFDDDRVIAGQGTVGLEIVEQVPDLDCVIVPVGGGGLISGVATAVKELRPEARVIGVQAENAPAMYQSRKLRSLQRVDTPGSIADGIAVGEPSARTLQIVLARVDDMVTVSEREIARGMLELLEHHKLVAEGAGATPVVGLEKCCQDLSGRTVVLVISGGNADVTTLAGVIDRGLVEAGRAVRLQVTLADRPGSLANLTEVIAEANANIVEIYHDRLGVSLELGQAEVEVVLATRGPEHVTEVLGLLHEEGFDARRVD